MILVRFGHHRGFDEEMTNVEQVAIAAGWDDGLLDLRGRTAHKKLNNTKL